MKSLMLRVGNFFFRYRNRAFPLIMIAVFMLAVPPAEMFNSEKFEQIKDIVALLIALSGLTLRAVVIGFVYIKRGGMNKQVYADTLVTEGIFGLCRNPLYVGNILIYIGVFLMHGNPWVIVVGMGIYLFIYRCIVMAEETYLEKKFGAKYRTYCKEVPRWGIKFSNFKKATKGMHFNFRRVILKDYTTIGISLIMLALTEGYEEVGEYLQNPSAFTNHDNVTYLAVAIGLLVAMIAVVKLLKKHKWLVETA